MIPAFIRLSLAAFSFSACLALAEESGRSPFSGNIRVLQTGQDQESFRGDDETWRQSVQAGLAIGAHTPWEFAFSGNYVLMNKVQVDSWSLLYKGLRYPFFGPSLWHVGVILGGQHPRSWRDQSFEPSQMRIVFGVHGGVRRGSFRLGALFESYSPFEGDQTESIDSIDITYRPSAFYKLQVEAQNRFISILNIEGTLGTYIYDGAELDTPMGSYSFSESPTTFGSAAAHLVLMDKLFLGAGLVQVFGDPDYENIYYNTGRRALPESYDSVYAEIRFGGF